MEDLVIVGSSGHAKAVIDIVEQEGVHKIAGLLDPFREVDEETMGYRVLGKVEDLPALLKTYALKKVLVAIGDNFIRSKEVERVKAICPTLSFVCAIHPKASVAVDAMIGEGTVVMAGAAIGPSSRVGPFCILNTHSSLNHDSQMDPFSSLGPGATVAGNCQIGEYSAINIGAVVLHRVLIGPQTVIGASSLVTKDVESLTVAYGTPAKAIRRREPGEPYL